MSETTYTLVPSTNRGRYSLDDPEQGLDITSGDRIAIQLGGRWIEGSVEHSSRKIYAIELGPDRVYSGYSFFADDGGMCGLCAGMKVKLL